MLSVKEEAASKKRPGLSTAKAVACVGIAYMLLLSWVDVIFSYGSLYIALDQTFIRAAYMAGLAAGSAAVCGVVGFRELVRRSAVLLCAAGVGLCALFVLLSFLSSLLTGAPMAVAALSGLFLSGAAAAMAFAVLGDVCLGFGPRVVIVALSAGQLAGVGFTSIVASFASSFVLPVAVVLFAGAFLLLLPFAGRRAPLKDAAASRPAWAARFPMPLKLSVAIAVVNAFLTSSQAIMLSEPAASSAVQQAVGSQSAAVFVGLLLLVVGVLFFWKNSNLGFTYQPALPLMAGAAVMLSLLDGEGYLPFGVAGAAATVINVFCWGIYSDISGRYHLPAYLVTAWGRMLIGIGSVLGIAMGVVVSPLVGEESAQLNRILASVSLYAVMLFPLIALNSKEVIDGWGKMSATLPHQGGADDLLRNVSALAERSGLTEREEEVLALLARGRSLAYIGETLYISRNTVKVHVSNIYKKMDVHTRQELLDRLE